MHPIEETRVIFESNEIPLSELQTYLTVVAELTSKALIDVSTSSGMEREIARADLYLAHEAAILSAILNTIDASSSDEIPEVS